MDRPRVKQVSAIRKHEGGKSTEHYIAKRKGVQAPIHTEFKNLDSEEDTTS
jgi:hypothetical protein